MNDISSQRKTILIAEDETDFGLLLMFQLQQNGYRTLVTNDGRQALDNAFEIIPDLILLDLLLPNLHGYEVCRLLKQSKSTSHIPVVMLTAITSPDAQLKGLRLGADDYITKPCRITHLLMSIRILLFRRRMDHQKVSI
jgi:DNA-binding response OmpR family regulator